MTTIDGIGQLISRHKLYVEEFQLQTPTNIENGKHSKSLGELDLEIGVYKLFCSFEGIPRKRFVIDSGNLSYISTLTEKYQAVLNKEKALDQERVEKFSKFNSKKANGSWCKFWVQAPIVSLSETADLLTSVFEALDSRFTFTEVLERFEEKGITLDYQIGVKDHGFVSVNMFNENYETIGKRRVFTNVNVVKQSVNA